MKLSLHLLNDEGFRNSSLGFSRLFFYLHSPFGIGGYINPQISQPSSLSNIHIFYISPPTNLLYPLFIFMSLIRFLLSTLATNIFVFLISCYVVTDDHGNISLTGILHIYIYFSWTISIFLGHLDAVLSAESPFPPVLSVTSFETARLRCTTAVRAMHQALTASLQTRLIKEAWGAPTHRTSRSNWTQTAESSLSRARL